MSGKIRVFLADDHAVVRKGLEALIGTQPDMVVIGNAGNGQEAVEAILPMSPLPDVILLDIQMPHKTGLEAIKEIKAVHPEARILVLTSFGDKNIVFEAIKAGALGFLLKDSSPQELIQAIHHVHEGRSSLHPDIAMQLIQEIHKPQKTLPPTTDPLTAREEGVLKLVAQGLSNDAIAERLVISEKTVRTHITNILDKLHVANRTQAALYALRQGIAQLDDGS